jgi:hypothetical protein
VAAILTSIQRYEPAYEIGLCVPWGSL